MPTAPPPTGAPPADDHLHGQVADDLPAYALGTLPPRESAEVARHVEVCATCATALAEYAAVRRLLPLGLAPSDPPDGARERLLARARAGRRPDASSPPSSSATTPPPTPLGRGRRPRLAPIIAVAAAVAAVLVLGLVARDRWFAAEPAPRNAEAVVAELRGRTDTRALAMAPPESAPPGTGELLLPADGGDGGLVVRGLPALPPDRSYQLWFRRPDGSRVSGGVFAVDASGDGVTVVDVPADLADFEAFGITEEPAGGSPAPTGRGVLVGRLEA